MTIFEIAAILFCLAAVFGFINYRTAALPTTIGVMAVALLFSLLLIGSGSVFPGIKEWAVELISGIDFSQTLLHGMLGFLLFAGALHVDLDELLDQARIIASLATVGVIVSALLVGTLCWQLLQWTPFPLPFHYCLLFGALISPTDPIAVLGILKTAGVPKNLELKITGESLLNDGVGVVLFLLILETASEGGDFSLAHAGLLFLQEAVGGALFGFGIGYLAFRMLRLIDDYQIEVVITLALVTGGYALAERLHLSAPIAMVVAGLLIGNKGRQFAMSEKTRKNLDTFWELIDSILNAILFSLLGLEIMALQFDLPSIAISAAMVLIVLAGRFVSVAAPIMVLNRFRSFSPKVLTLLTWGGLRGGISVALALSLPNTGERHLVLIMTYVVVVFSIMVQGLTMGRVVARMGRLEEE